MRRVRNSSVGRMSLLDFTAVSGTACTYHHHYQAVGATRICSPLSHPHIDVVLPLFVVPPHHLLRHCSRFPIA